MDNFPVRRESLHPMGDLPIPHGAGAGARVALVFVLVLTAAMPALAQRPAAGSGAIVEYEESRSRNILYQDEKGSLVTQVAPRVSPDRDETALAPASAKPRAAAPKASAAAPVAAD